MAPHVTESNGQTARENAGLAILMIAPEPFFAPRGTPFSVLHRVRALTEAGHRVDLVTYPFGDDVALPGLRILRCPRMPGIRRVKIGPSPAKLALDVQLYRMARRVLASGRYDVVHTHEEAAFFGIRLARRYGLVHVYDMHSSLPEQLHNFQAYDWLPVRLLFSRLEDAALAGSAGIITVCPELARIVEEKVPGTPHAMIENTGDDRVVFEPVRRDVRAEFGLEGRPLILYTGTLEPYQGIDLLLGSMARVRKHRTDAVLLIVGGRRKQIEAYRRRVSAAGLDDCISFAGTVPPSHIPAFVEAADVIVSPRTRGTNTPAKIYAYLRSGRPVLATDVQSHTQVLDGTVAHLVPPDPAAMGEGICRLLDDPEYAGALAAAASHKAEAEYSGRRYEDSVARFYERVIRAHAGGSD